MWVDPVRRGRDVATVPISMIARWTVNIGAEILTLSVMPDNIAARHTYERNGLRGYHSPGDLLMGGRHELVMVRDLGPERTVEIGAHTMGAAL
jgi:ribosomal protein S18 acetylase RimI-like enzyme